MLKVLRSGSSNFLSHMYIIWSYPRKVADRGVCLEFATDVARATAFATADVTVSATGKGCNGDVCGYSVRQMIG